MTAKNDWVDHIDKRVAKNIKEAHSMIAKALKNQDASLCMLAHDRIYEVVVMLNYKHSAKHVSEKEYFFALDSEGRPFFHKKGDALESKKMQMRDMPEVSGYA